MSLNRKAKCRKKALLSALIITLTAGIGCKSSPNAAATADAIYFGGPIITVNDARPNAEAVAIKDGKILMVGTRSEIESVGLKHFLPGSDWPYNGDDLADRYNRVYPELPLTQREWTIIRRNVAPYVRYELRSCPTITTSPNKAGKARGRGRGFVSGPGCPRNSDFPRPILLCR